MKKKNSTVFDASCYIHNQLKGSKLTAASLRKVNKELKLIKHFFGTGDLSSVVLCSIIQESFLEGMVQMKTLALHFEIDNLQLVSFAQAIDELCVSGLIERYDRPLDRKSRRIAPMPHVLDALIKGAALRVRPKDIDGLESFFGEFCIIKDLRNKGNIESVQYIVQVNQLCLQSKKLPGIHYFLTFELPPAELALLIGVAHALYQGTETTDIMESVKEITQGQAEYYQWCGRIRSQELSLFKNELIEFALFDLGIDSEVTLTQIPREQLFSLESNSFKHAFKPTLTHYMAPESVQSVKLIFDEPLRNSLDGIRRSLMPENFNALQSRMKERNLNGGFTILLHGLPGTGKTESVYQIARESNRVVLRLEISKIKVMWVGESEKNLKKVFTEYKRARKSHEQDPILLFNEADAIFSRRRDVASGVDQMENSLQNILLQELEEFEGILIATTNLVQNLDSAFERRFLYKLNFNIPSPGTRQKLLSEAFHELSDMQIQKIATKYEFTGSTIQNIKKKLLLSELINSSTGLDSTKLEEMFIEEANGLVSNTRIGFRI